MLKQKRRKGRGPTTVVLDRELVDAIDRYRRAHPLRPGRRAVVQVALEHYLNPNASTAPHAGEQ